MVPRTPHVPLRAPPARRVHSPRAVSMVPAVPWRGVCYTQDLVQCPSTNNTRTEILRIFPVCIFARDLGNSANTSLYTVYREIIGFKKYLLSTSLVIFKKVPKTCKRPCNSIVSTRSANLHFSKEIEKSTPDLIKLEPKDILTRSQAVSHGHAERHFRCQIDCRGAHYPIQIDTRAAHGLKK